MKSSRRWLCVPIASVMLGALTASQVQSQAGTNTIQINRGGTGEGRVTSDPAGINCTIGPNGPTGTCAAPFRIGTQVKLRATAAANSKFDGWAPVNSCRDAPQVKVAQIGRPHVCQPVFSFRQPPTFLLQALPEGSGTVASSAVGIDCTRNTDTGAITGICAENFPRGSNVTLTATPLSGWTFTRWSSTDPDCTDETVSMDKLTRCTAIFVR